MSSETKTIATHSSGFHPDDVFAVATLFRALDRNKCEIIRTRDEGMIEEADYVVDVGFEHDAENNRFDHHQEGGAGKRDNGIPYASFGLVWKKFGNVVSGSKEVAEHLDETLVQPIDAFDNGMSPVYAEENKVRPVLLQTIIHYFKPVAGEDRDMNEAFEEAVNFAGIVLDRAIVSAHHELKARERVRKAYDEAEDRTTIVFGEGEPYIPEYFVIDELNNFSEPLYFIQYRGSDDRWSAKCVRDDVYDFTTNRKLFPKEWAGKEEEELSQISGVSDAYFCHNNRFVVIAHTKEGVLELVQKALKT